MVQTVTGLLHSLKKEVSKQEYQNITVAGEVSNLTKSRNNTFFSLRDDYSLLNCVGSKDLLLEEGDLVEIHGDINIYTPRGKLQLKTKAATLKGEGSFKKQYRRAKQKLLKEKLIPKKKQDIPSWPKKVAVITSKEGAVIKDILDVFNKAVSPPKTTIYNTPVQGKYSPQKIITALQNIESDVDCIIIARGGGSTTDLEGYNNYRLAKHIAKLTKPVITSIGHKTDTTIADLVSDLPVSTPTKAAYKVVKQPDTVKQQLKTLHEDTYRTIKNKIRRTKRLQSLESSKHTIKEKIWSLRKDLQKANNILQEHPLSTLNTRNACLIYKESDPVSLQDAEGNIKLVSSNTTKHIQL